MYVIGINIPTYMYLVRREGKISKNNLVRYLNIHHNLSPALNIFN